MGVAATRKDTETRFVDSPRTQVANTYHRFFNIESDAGIVPCSRFPLKSTTLWKMQSTTIVQAKDKECAVSSNQLM